MERDIDATLYPCGHKFMCSVCAKKIMRTRKDNNLEVDCPVCRHPVTAFLTSYTPREWDGEDTVTWWKCSGCAAKIDYTCQGCMQDQEYTAATAARSYSSALERHIKAANAELDVSSCLFACCLFCLFVWFEDFSFFLLTWQMFLFRCCHCVVSPLSTVFYDQHTPNCSARPVPPQRARVPPVQCSVQVVLKVPADSL